MLKPALLLISASLILTAGLFARDQLTRTGLVTFQSTSTCKLEQGCRAVSGDREITLLSDQRPNSHTPFALKATLKGFEADAITLELQGVEMFMGLNRYALQQHSKTEFNQQLSIPVCSTGAMQWRAQLHIESGGTTELAEFVFTAE